jgi:DNA-binding beta-propeller fold protein YncE
MIIGSGNFTYKLVEDWAKLPENESFYDVFNVRIDSQDRVYLFTGHTNPIMLFDRDGHLLSSWGKGLFSQAHGGCLGPDNSIYCVDFGFHTANKYTPEGQLIFQMGQKGRPSETGYRDFIPGPDTDFEANWDTIERSGAPFNFPTNIFVTPDNQIYISDGYGNARVHRFDQNGRLLYSWGEPGRGVGCLRVPHSVWVDQHDRVWVCDRQNGRLQIFDTQGRFLDTWGGFDWPCDLFIDQDEYVYVAELQRRITILDKNGKRLVRFTCQEPDKQKAVLLAPHSIAADSRGDLYVGDVGMIVYGVNKKGRAVQKFARV